MRGCEGKGADVWCTAPMRSGSGRTDMRIDDLNGGLLTNAKSHPAWPARSDLPIFGRRTAPQGSMTIALIPSGTGYPEVPLQGPPARRDRDPGEKDGHDLPPLELGPRARGLRRKRNGRECQEESKEPLELPGRVGEHYIAPSGGTSRRPGSASRVIGQGFPRGGRPPQRFLAARDRVTQAGFRTVLRSGLGSASEDDDVRSTGTDTARLRGNVPPPGPPVSHRRIVNLG